MRVVVIGGSGLAGASVVKKLRADGHQVLSVHTQNYAELRGTNADVVVNANGNSYRYRANQDPHTDFSQSVASVEQSIHDFPTRRYIYLSTVDVYPDRHQRERTHEDESIDSRRLDAYAFHKWLAERIVEHRAPSATVLRLGTLVGPGLRKGPVYDLLHDNPLHVSLESELVFIDTETVATLIARFLTSGPPRLNVAGREPVRLARLSPDSEVSPEANDMVYRYDIETSRAQAWLPLPTSEEVALRQLGMTQLGMAQLGMTQPGTTQLCRSPATEESA